MRTISPSKLCAFTVLAMVAACSSNGTDNNGDQSGPAYTVTIQSGNNQVAFALAELPINPSVHVTDAAGHDAIGVTVVFAAASTSALNGNQPSATVVTDSQGIAVSPPWRMGLTGPASLSANVYGNSRDGVTFSATAYDRLSVTKALDFIDSARAGSSVPVMPGVFLSNLTTPGPRPSGVSVTFVVDSGGGSISGATVTTDNTGFAKVGNWTLGSQPGTNHLTAYISWPVGNYTVSWTARGTP